MVEAQVEARALRHGYIGTEHLLLGLAHEGEGLAAQALEAFGIGRDAIRQQVEQIIGIGGAEYAQSGHVPFTPRAKKVLELALREALQLGRDYIGTEHILLGLVREGQGVAAQILQRLGADLPAVRQQVIKVVQGYGGARPPGGTWPAAGRSGPLPVSIPLPEVPRGRERMALSSLRSQLAAVESRLAALESRFAAVEKRVGAGPDDSDPEPGEAGDAGQAGGAGNAGEARNAGDSAGEEAAGGAA